MQIAFYRGTKPGLAGVFNRAVRWWTNGPYSHCELVVSMLPGGQAQCWSSANLDGGVRQKVIVLDPAHWDLLEVPWVGVLAAVDWFWRHEGDGYDTLGLFGFVGRRGDGDQGKWFCSEAVAAALGFEDPWRYDPNTLAAVIHSMGRLVRPISILEM